MAKKNQTKSSREIFEEGLRDYTSEQLQFKIDEAEEIASPYRAEIRRRAEGLARAKKSLEDERARTAVRARKTQHAFIAANIYMFLAMAPDHDHGRGCEGNDESPSLSIWSDDADDTACTRCCLLAIRDETTAIGAAEFIPLAWSFTLAYAADPIHDPDEEKGKNG